MNGHLRQSSRIYNRIRKIIEDARSNIARVVNTEMVIAYWHIGKEIVKEEQRAGPELDMENAFWKQSPRDYPMILARVLMHAIFSI